MKLPGINYGGQAESLGRPNVNLPVAEARAWSGALTTIGDAVQDYINKKDTESSNQRLMDDRMESVDTLALLNKPRLSPNEIPANVQYQQTEKKLVNGVMTDVSREFIPTYEVQQQIYDNLRASQKERAREELSSGAFKKYEVAHDQYTISGRIQNSMSQLKRAREDQADKLDARLKGLEERGLWDDARTLTTSNPFLSEGDIALKLANIDIKQARAEEEAAIEAELGPILDAFRDEDVTRMRQARDYLDDPNYSGPLGVEERATLDTKLRTRINSVLSKEEASDTSYKKKLKEQSSVLIKGYENGYFGDPDETLALGRQLDVLGMTKERDDLFRAADIAGKIALINSLPLEEREPTLLTWGADSKDDPEAWNRFVEIRKGVEQGRDNYRNDSFGEINRRDPGSIAPVSFDDPASMQQRRIDTEVLSEQNGYVSSYISDEEATQLNNQIEDAGIEEQMALATNVSAGFGSEAHKVWAKTKAASAAPEMSYAAELVARGEPELGKSVFRGIDILKENKDFLKDHMVDMRNDSDFRGSVLSFPAGKERDAYSGAVIARYADLVNLKGLDRYDSSTMDKAIEDVSMGEVEYGGARFVNPIPGVADKNAFEKFMDNLTPEYILSLGKPANATAEQIANGLKDNGPWLPGEPTFIPYPVSRNAFFIQFADNPGVFVQEYLPDGTTRPFRFFYDPIREQEIRDELEPERVRVNRRGRPIRQAPDAG